MWKGGGGLLSVYKDKDQWHAKRTECPVPKKKIPSPLLAEHSQSHSSRVGRWSVLVSAGAVFWGADDADVVTTLMVGAL